ncbi:MAG: beta-N-acetylhexosaminidase [Gammaproteobacteria bacterium]|nr:MAG: beta-N-acetylhexosaminidase [Gammaproteobacteria bacterium]
MTLGPLMLDVAGTELTAEDRELIAHPSVGGVILFTRNCATPEQVKQLIDDIHAAHDPHVLVAVDQEGGRVQRFRDGFTRLPPLACLGALYDTDRARAKHLAHTMGWLMAAEMRAVGVDISFAPVLDLDYGVSKIIGNRALHRHPESVAELAHAYQSGMHEAGMAATGKHFPGHGAVEADSHLDLPIDPRLYEDIAQWDMVPFERMVHYGLAAVMMAHIVYSSVDANPAGFSRFWIKAVLRDQLGFQGLVLSDDLSMEGAAYAGNHVERAGLSLEAGCDMVLVCNDRENAVAVAESLEGYSNPVSHTRMSRMHGHAAPGLHELQQEPRWEQAVAAAQRCEEMPELDLE